MNAALEKAREAREQRRRDELELETVLVCRKDDPRHRVTLYVEHPQAWCSHGRMVKAR